MKVFVSAPVSLNSETSSAWNAFRYGLESTGLKVVDARDNQRISDPLVVFNWTRQTRSIVRSSLTDSSRRALVLMEPPATNPAAYSEKTLRQFGHVWAASPVWASLTKGRPFTWPQELEVNTEMSRGRNFDATMINACKWSAARSQLYSLRRQVIKACDNTQVTLAVAGDGWAGGVVQRTTNIGRAVIRQSVAPDQMSWRAITTQWRTRPRYYLGHVCDKADVVSLAPVSVVIENSPDYVSEKLIDVVRHGAVPLYVGPPLDRFNIDPRVAIACPPIPEVIAERINSISPDELESAKRSGRSWLLSSAAQQHDATRVFERLGTEIARSFRY